MISHRHCMRETTIENVVPIRTITSEFVTAIKDKDQRKKFDTIHLLELFGCLVCYIIASLYVKIFEQILRQRFNQKLIQCVNKVTTHISLVTKFFVDNLDNLTISFFAVMSPLLPSST